jgi:peptidoglycan/xylan/chitin deacetylase (PgdA/CDA1 family)
MSGIATGAGILIAAQLGPGLVTIPWLRRTAMPRLHGLGRPNHVALTFDDGPDPRSTPRFLDLLARRGVRATFFLLGTHVRANADLVLEMAALGHELAVHGWDHGCLAVKRPLVLDEQILRAKDTIENVTQASVRHYRPPYGWLTGEGVLAARRHGLRTVLWTAWGRDWSATSTPASIVARVESGMLPGATVLLHDADRTSAPGSWRHTLAATERLLDRWDAESLQVGPLAEHGRVA